jgi:hypothetical protein
MNALALKMASETHCVNICGLVFDVFSVRNVNFFRKDPDDDVPR